MKRRLLNVCAAVCCLLFAASGSMWVRSHFVADSFFASRLDGGRKWNTSVGCDDGYLIASFGHVLHQRRHDEIRFSIHHDPADEVDHRTINALRTGVSLPGFACDWKSNPRLRVWSASIVVHFSLVCTGMGILPMVWMIKLMRARRRNQESCAKCGYDLRATPDRCPECGTVRGKIQISTDPLPLS